MEAEQWLLCPVCESKSRIKIRDDTEIKNLPLLCHKCKQKSIINVEQFNVSVIKEPDA